MWQLAEQDQAKTWSHARVVLVKGKFKAENIGFVDKQAKHFGCQKYVQYNDTKYVEANCTVTTQFIFVRDTSKLTRYGGHHRVRLPLLDTIVQFPYMGMIVRF